MSVCSTELTEVGLLLFLLAGPVEEHDPCDGHGELPELLLFVSLQQNHEGSQLSGREDALQGR